MNITSELITKAKEAKSAEELLALAKENGLDFTEENASAYYAQLHPTSGELSDDELDNVSGGACHEIGGQRMVTTLINLCKHWTCPHCGKEEYDSERWSHQCGPNGPSISPWGGLDCSSCKMCSYEKGIWYCNHKANYK